MLRPRTELHRRILRRTTAATVALAIVGLLVGILPMPAGVPVADPAPEAAAQGGEISGVDVASWQHPTGQPIDWNAVRNGGHSFAFIKSTEGPSSPGGAHYTNPWFARDWVDAGAAGLYRGAYHFAQPREDVATAVADARHFIDVSGVMNGSADLPPVLDLEVNNGLPPDQVARWAKAWLDEVERLTGRVPIIYTGPFFWRDKVASSAFTRYPLWIASYTSASSPTSGPIPGGWATWTIWQYTSQGTVPGIPGPVDVNRFCCDAGTLAALAAGGPVGRSNPFGSVDFARRVPGSGLEVGGWAIDPDTTAPINVHLYVDGAWGGSHLANVARPDVGRSYPQYGANHGYTVRLDAPAGARRVCGFAINAGLGSTNTPLGCRDVASNPRGTLSSVSAVDRGTIRVEGWTVDADVAESIPVHLYVDGKFVAQTRADQPSSAAQQRFPGIGANHGFAFERSVGPGQRNVCVFAINRGPGTTNPQLGCRDVLVPGVDPVGWVEVARASSARLTVGGWAADVHATSGVAVEVLVDGTLVASTPTDRARRDVAERYPFATTAGFRTEVPMRGSGPRVVCVRARNVGAGVDRTISCRTVTLPATPIGNLESVELDGSRLRARGWALDPDTSDPLDIHLYVDGAWGGSLRADGLRADVVAAYPGFAATRGFDGLLPPVTDGTRQVCAYAINKGAGATNPLIGCQTVEVSTAPVGNAEVIERDTADPTSVRVRGWVLDPIVAAPAGMRVRVNDVVVAVVEASVVRGDVVAAYPDSTGPHGVEVLVPAAPGARVCVDAVDRTVTRTSPLRCVTT